MAQLSLSGRRVFALTVSQGDVYRAEPLDTVWTPSTNITGDTPALNYTGLVYYAVNNQIAYFADGVNWVKYNPRLNQTQRWSPSYGALPVDSENNTPRLICTWRGRTVLSGLLLDPQNWFMSRVGDPTDFDYFPTSDRQSPAQAIAGNNAPQGLIGDLTTCLIPYSDDVLIFGGDHSIYLMAGDPMAGGQIDLVSNTIGMAWGLPYCMDPYGTVYFVSNKLGIYSYVPGQRPQRISGPIEQLVTAVNTGETVILAQWNDRWQGVHFFFTPASEPAPATHLFFEARTQAWWKEVFANDDHNPVCVCTYDGNTADDRVGLRGGWDGYVRCEHPQAEDDDGTPIASTVVLGPWVTKELDEIMVKDIQAVMGETSNDVDYSFYRGSTAEIALSRSAERTGTWKAGRNIDRHVRIAGHAVYVRIDGDSPWAIESLRADVETQGKVRRRGY